MRVLSAVEVSKLLKILTAHILCSCGSNVPSAARFYSLTTWRCEKGAEWVNAGALQFHDFKMVDNEKSGLDLKVVFGTSWGLGDQSAGVVNSLIIGHSATVPSNYESSRAIVSFFISTFFSRICHNIHYLSLFHLHVNSVWILTVLLLLFYSVFFSFFLFFIFNFPFGSCHAEPSGMNNNLLIYLQIQMLPFIRLHLLPSRFCHDCKNPNACFDRLGRYISQVLNTL